MCIISDSLNSVTISLCLWPFFQVLGLLVHYVHQICVCFLVLKFMFFSFSDSATKLHCNSLNSITILLCPLQKFFSSLGTFSTLSMKFVFWHWIRCRASLVILTINYMCIISDTLNSVTIFMTIISFFSSVGTFSTLWASDLCLFSGIEIHVVQL